MNDYYALLHLQPGCSAAEIRSAYRRLARRYHPDLNPSPDAARRMAALNEAYAVLGNPMRRRAYDLARGHASPVGRPGRRDDTVRGTTGGTGEARHHTPTVTPTRYRSAGVPRPHGGRHSRRLRWTLALVSVLLACAATLLTVLHGGGAAHAPPPPPSYPSTVASTAAQPLLTIWQPAESATLLTFSPDAALLAAASRTGTITVWRTDTGEPVATLSGHSGAVQSLVFLAKGRLLVSISIDQTARLWDLAAGREVSRLRMPEEDGTALSLALSPSGELLAMAHATHVVAVWSLVSHQKIVRFPLPPDAGPVTALRFAPDASLLAATLAGGRTALFRLPPVGEAEIGNTPAPVGLIAQLGTPFIGFGPHGTVVALAGRGDEGFDSTTGGGPRIQVVVAAGTALATAFAVSADGRTAAWTGAPVGGLVPAWSVGFWDTAAGHALPTTPAHSTPVLALALAADGSLAATLTRDDTIRLWRVPR